MMRRETGTAVQGLGDRDNAFVVGLPSPID